MKETPEEIFNKLRVKCHDQSFHSFGKAYMFEKRSQHYNRLLNFITVLGIIVPVTIGATVLGYGINNNFLKFVIALAIPSSIIQLIFSIISVVYKWSDELAYANESAQEHYFLSDRFKKLGEFPPNEYGELDHAYELINTRLKSRTEQDSKHNIKDWELRFGMRYALREFQKECISCKQTPFSMTPTSCDVCGNFKNTLLNRL